MGQKLTLCFTFKVCLHSLQYAHVWSDVTVLRQHSYWKQLFFKVVQPHVLGVVRFVINLHWKLFAGH